MADNNDLRVVVGLNIPDSVSVIKDDLKTIEKILAHDDKGKLKIVGSLNLGKTIGNINSQIKQLEKSVNTLKITPQLDMPKGGVNNITQSITKESKVINTTIQDVIDNIIAKQKQLSPVSQIMIQRFEELKSEITRTFSPDEIKGFSNALNQISTRNGFLALRDGIQEVNTDGTKLTQVLEHLSTVIREQFVTKIDAFRPLTEGLTNSEKALKTLQSYFKDIGFSQSSAKEFTQWLNDKSIDIYGYKIKGIKNTFQEILPILNGISASYPSFFNQSNTLGKDVMTLFDGSERANVDGISKSLDKFIAKLSLVRGESNTAKKEYNELLSTIISKYNIQPQNNSIQLTLDQLKEICTTIPNAEKYLGEYRDTLERTLLKSNGSQNNTVQSFRQVQDSVNQTTQAIKQTETEYINFSKEVANSKIRITANDKIDDITKDLRDQLSKLKGFENLKVFDWAYNAKGQVKSIAAEVQLTNNQIETLYFNLEKVKSSKKDIEGNTGASLIFTGGSSSESGIIKANQELIKQNEVLLKQYANLDSYITSAQSFAQKIRAQWSDINGGKSVQDAEHISVLQSKYAELMKTIESLRGADDNTIKTLKANIKAQEAELNSLVSSYHNAEKVATDLRTKGFDTVKDITGSKINTLEQSIVNTLGSTQKLSNELSSIRSKFEELGKTGLTQETKATLLTQILDDIDKAKAKLGTLSEVEKSIKSVERTMTNLDRMSGASIFSKYWNNDDVKQIQYRITQLKEDYKGALDVLKNNDIGTPKFKAAQDVIARLDEKFKELGVDIRSVRSELSNENDMSRFQKQVANLTNTITTLQNNIHLTDSQKAGLSGLLNEVGLAKDKATLDEIAVKLAKLRGEIKQTGIESKNFDQISKSVEKVISDLDTMSRSQIFNTHSNNAGVIEFQGKIKGLSDTAKQVKADLNALGDSKAIPPELRTRVDNLTESFKKLEGSNKTLQVNLRQNDGWARTERQIQTLTARIKEYMAVNTKAAKKYSGQFDGLLSGLSQAEMNKDSEAVRRLSTDFQILRSQIKAAGDQGKTLGQMIVDNAKKFSMWFSLTSNIMRAWRTLKQMVTTVKELDTAMTALKRVTEGTSATYNKFLETAIKNAKELKMDLVDLVTQSAEWAKRGYSIEDSSKLAKASGIYSVVADIDNATAVQHLTTVMKTYNMTVEEAMDITDRLDNVANRYALTAADLGEILSHSVSAMKVAGNTLDEVIALGGAITQVTGSANEAGSTLKVLSMRLRGAKSDLESASEDTEGMVESTSKLREQIMALTNVNGTGGFDIMADADNFKSTYEIMQGISKVWKDISDVNQANKICLYVQKCA